MIKVRAWKAVIISMQLILILIMIAVLMYSVNNCHISGKFTFFRDNASVVVNGGQTDTPARLFHM